MELIVGGFSVYLQLSNLYIWLKEESDKYYCS